MANVTVDPAGGSNPPPPAPHGHPPGWKPTPGPYPPAGTSAPPGGGGGGGGPAPGPAPQDPFAPYKRGSSNTAYDQAVAVTEQFLQIMGWPAGLKAEDLELHLLQAGLETSPEQAYNYLFTQIPDTLQKANPNAEFGMTPDAYVTQLNSFKDSYSYFTGSSDIPPDVLRMAIDQGWTQTEMMTFLQNDSRHTDPKSLPWLAAGMGYRDVKNQFVQTYGKAPTDPTQLASWYNFKTGAQQVGTGAVAAETASQGPQRGGPSQSETR